MFWQQLTTFLKKEISRMKYEEYQRKLSSEQKPSEPVLITAAEESKRFMKDCFLAIGTPPENAEIVAHNLITADRRGYYSHGLNRLELYIRDIQNCRTDAAVLPEVVKETAAVALVDGKNGLGSVTGKHCMELAICKAKDVGIGFVAAKMCNHFGLASIYPLQAIEHGLIGFSVTNTAPLMCPIGAKDSALGTNPLSLGACGLNGDSFVLDMATTVVALGKIEMYSRTGEKIPPVWALNAEGQPETDPGIAFKAMRLMPLGGTAMNSGHKGYGLAMLVEIFSGLLAGAASGPFIRSWIPGEKESKPANLGSAYMAIDPKGFEPGFEKRLQDVMCYLRNMEPVDPKKPVMVHGDFERNHLKIVEKDGGLRYVPNQHKTAAKLAEELKVKPLCSTPLKESC